ncbi:DUF1816 domain-containing protein [Chamaesiphon sp. OTE_75_metabat_556]|uniref:DUF1816 domain-containing protein n=1 Tax=Chamaesiphon sp. OTE_75_metabat_556 TaxID=2964692 RepID=UPI00286A0789|nr:DUF1816 domain-containing protein [Chamaesiphon sp. OTE_75_metabat_556]
MNIQDLWSSALHLMGQAWWVEITTDRPHCSYYFGPFATAVEADEAKAGYIEDLESESAQGIQVAIKRCKPVQMTIDYDSQETALENYDSIVKASMSGQFS